MALNFNLLRSFYVVVEAGSVSAAAREGFTSQPALSKAIRELEKQLGLPLLERTARGVVLTAAGTTLHEHARALFAMERDTEEAILSHRKLEGGSLRIGASSTISTYILPPLLGGFREQYPHLRLRVTRENTRHIEELLGAYELDVALVEGPPHNKSVRAQPWREDELICVCAANHPLASAEYVWPHDLRNYPWVTREEGSGTREVAERALRPYGLPPEGALELGGAEAVKQAAAAGLGLAVVSREAAADQLALGKLRMLRLAEVEIRRPYYLLHLKGRPIIPAARAFEEFLCQEKYTIPTGTAKAPRRSVQRKKDKVHR